MRFPAIPVILSGIICCFALSGCGGNREDSELRAVVRRACRQSFPDGNVIFTGTGNAEIRNRQGDAIGSVRFNETADEAAQGFRGTVPVWVILDASGTVLHTGLLPNREDAAYLEKLERAGLWDEWSGFPRREAAELPVDTVTGATFSSRGAIESIQTLLK